VSVTSRSSIETTERIELFLAWELSSTYPTLCYKDIRVPLKIRVLPSTGVNPAGDAGDTSPQYFGWGGRQREYPRQYYYVLLDITDQYWLPSIRSASSRFHSAIRRHQFASVRQADSRLTRLVPPNLELALTPLLPSDTLPELRTLKILPHLVVRVVDKTVDGRACGSYLRQSTRRCWTHIVYCTSVDCNPLTPLLRLVLDLLYGFFLQP